MRQFEILADSYKNKILNSNKTYKREIFDTIFNTLQNHNLVLIGLRQVGKTTLAEQLVNKYIKLNENKEILVSNEISSGKSSKDSFYYSNIKSLGNFEPQELIKYITEQKFEVVLLDEIQIISDWTNFAQSIIDLNPKTRFIFTGSNAKALKSEIMVNRAKVFFINTLSFNEFNHFWSCENFADFLKYGSYPKFDRYDDYKVQYSEIVDEQIIDKIITLDSDGKVTASKFKSLMKKVADSIGNELKVSALDFSDITRPTATNYIGLMLSSRLISRIWKNSDTSDKMIGKVYLNDKSMLYRLNNWEELNSNQYGSLIENIVFNYLDNYYCNSLNMKNQIEYFIGKNRQEIDFVVDSAKLLIEVKYRTIIDKDELSSNLNKTLGNDKSDYKRIVITKNTDGEANGWKFVPLIILLKGGIDGIL